MDTFFTLGLLFCVIYTLVRGTQDVVEWLATTRRRWLSARHENRHPWGEFLQARTRAIDWLFSGEGDDSCAGDDAAIARTLSVTAAQVYSIRTRDRRND